MYLFAQPLYAQPLYAQPLYAQPLYAQPLYAPSFYAHIINGLLMLFAFILLYKNYSKISKLEPYKLVLLTLILSICVGVHGLSHAGLESIYNYNPLVTGFRF